jgi:hypothetical protein
LEINPQTEIRAAWRGGYPVYIATHEACLLPNGSEFSCAAAGPHTLMLVCDDGARYTVSRLRTAAAAIRG